MISPSQEEFLADQPDKIITVMPFDPKAREAGIALVRQLQEKLPQVEIIFGGSTPLGISGQNDLDVNILSTPEEYEKIKLPYGEQDYKTYMRKKYEFFNRILGLE
ncbi:MAG: hypothetical protein A3J07_01375 [Candidatus Doudnabacteria bacterium RIFCSPLOWO2_02_FULL_49_13]|uniref:Uncharacterized protein n=1 Tax=Candidatus Doudnabacteria bacterium RIFCSPHIGHO2_12_FULL_48_16 TaxID=1817838 RepID=A0A1F5PKD8_9BACT|nr:MAG: hypothetical protein A3B77_04300 [Candidatus Doudnabacteria bacterium RIFCSPHIGHO2_02_FULL_49_24]OGE88701.1 MAG: hypothetical protein A2760_01960 [Candidatus Doudnabacteria bacterium RIFCSPHIGHO2_01_FULL_50_67]OGE90386.1 MAG: hypothetical protein A3E29_04880 [Candidatus Doudnabacteria bacterium RIFCSPHIGHO2_12_FULL_48_16]OGE97093.1 MAG: hypothetical protein A2990_01870 [Candidatus Doudnabacteria bacterium RIFCSPLOWO2_01_FULL_49_40]OGF02441.1 MAG: hypothetical protein A3J07_01375 [Candid